MPHWKCTNDVWSMVISKPNSETQTQNSNSICKIVSYDSGHLINNTIHKQFNIISYMNNKNIH